jgi:RsiW-degrading membrane proteinase PrsW (M82 family)
MPVTQVLMVSAIVPSLLLVWYFRARDVFPEPSRVLWATFGLGVLTVIPVLMVALPVMSAIEGVTDPITLGFLKAFLTAAGPEELFKFAVVTLYCARHEAFDEPMDGVVYGATASLGFATLENILYVSSGGIGVAIMRALLAVPGHAMMGALMGYFVGQAKFRPAERTKLLALGYFVPFVLHGLYDWPLLSMKESATPGASAQSETPALFLLVTFAAFAFGWVWTVRVVRRLRAQQIAWATHNPAHAHALLASAGAAAPKELTGPTPPFAHSPYTVTPHYNAAPQGAQSQPVLGALLLVVGILLAAVGGFVSLGLALVFVQPNASTPAFGATELVTALVLGGLAPLALGVTSFAFGIKKLNGR